MGVVKQVIVGRRHLVGPCSLSRVMYPLVNIQKTLRDPASLIGKPIISMGHVQ